MKILIVGGIYARSAEYRRSHQHTPETILAEGLRARGHEVAEQGHHLFVPDDRYDLIHVHHVGRAAYLMACSQTRGQFIFTGHDGRMINGFEKSRVRKLIFELISRRCDAAVALGSREAAFFKSIGARRVETILNGIPGVYSSAAALPGTADRSGVLFVGQLIPLKGVDTLIRAFARLTPAQAPTLTLVYQNPLDEQALRGLALSLGVAERVIFAGPKSPAQLAELYARTQVFALPSHAEALPSVITEAMLAGAPVVSTRVGAIPDQLGPEGNFVEPGDHQGLAEALARVLAAPPDDAVRRALRDFAMQRSSPAAMAEGHERLYASLLAAGKRPHPISRLVDPVGRAAIRVYWGPPAQARPEGSAR